MMSPGCTVVDHTDLIEMTIRPDGFPVEVGGLTSSTAPHGGSWYLLSNYNCTYSCTYNHIRARIRLISGL